MIARPLVRGPGGPQHAGPVPGPVPGPPAPAGSPAPAVPRSW